MFHRLRKEVLEAALTRLEPKPLGRPPREVSPEQARCQELEQRVQSLESDLNLAEVRENIAHVMPQLLRDTDEPEKKTNRRKTTLPSWSRRKLRRRKSRARSIRKTPS